MSLAITVGIVWAALNIGFACGAVYCGILRDRREREHRAVRVDAIRELRLQGSQFLRVVGRPDPTTPPLDPNRGVTKH
jgi:hypothetical protein